MLNAEPHWSVGLDENGTQEFIASEGLMKGDDDAFFCDRCSSSQSLFLPRIIPRAAQHRESVSILLAFQHRKKEFALTVFYISHNINFYGNCDRKATCHNRQASLDNLRERTVRRFAGTNSKLIHNISASTKYVEFDCSKQK